jgi:glucarate dehydratase
MLKGGVLPGEDEVARRHGAARALSERARRRSIRTGGWLLKDAIRLMRDARDVVALCRGSVRRGGRLFGREVMAEFRRATGLPTATNMIATDWRRWCTRFRCNPWTFRSPIALLDDAGSVRVAQTCRDWGLTWGSHSNNHFDVSLRDVHASSAPPRRTASTAIDTHWIWQDGQRITKDLCRSGAASSTYRRSRARDRARHGGSREGERALQAARVGARDDAVAMQYLIPNWKFDPKRPCMVR